MPQSHFLKIRFNIILHLRLGLQSGLFPSGLPNKAPYAPVLSPNRATCPAHFIIDYVGPCSAGHSTLKETTVKHNFSFSTSIIVQQRTFSTV